jgi:hypothetical protein
MISLACVAVTRINLEVSFLSFLHAKHYLSVYVLSKRLQLLARSRRKTVKIMHSRPALEYYTREERHDLFKERVKCLDNDHQESAWQWQNSARGCQCQSCSESPGLLPCTQGQKSKDSQGVALSYHLPLSLHM